MTFPGLGGTDFDGDGLTNDEEARYGTDPFRADTDGDGLTDGQETYGTPTDPRLPDTDGDGVSDYQETQTPQYHLRPDLSDLISKPTGIEVVPKPGMDFTAALSESDVTAHQDGGHNTSPGGHPGDHGWQQPVDHITKLEVQYHGADPPPPAEQTADHITKLGVQFHPTDHGAQVEGTVDQPPFGSGAIIATADPTDIPPHLVHVEADPHAVHPPHPSVAADVADEVGPVEHAAPVEQVELVAHSDPGPTPVEHLHTDAIG